MDIIVISAGEHYEAGSVLALFPAALADQAEVFEASHADQYDWIVSEVRPLSGVAASDGPCAKGLSHTGECA